MMQHTDQLLRRATLLAKVWSYRFVPATDIVDVHLDRLRHKVDMPDEVPMIPDVRDAGFILRAAS
jgi:two-component system OmpR family response regulator